jgi:hypothetical protein
MQIIWDPAAVKKLSTSHTILELETFTVNDKQLTAYCVVPAEKLVSEFISLEDNKALHEKLIVALKNKDFRQANTFANLLMGRFGGELDTFYEEILSRITMQL